MSARNLAHDKVIAALVAEGWTITHDPLRLRFGGKDLYVDLAAEQTVVGAQREGERIAVEIQSFLGPSPVRNLQEALGQYSMYRVILDRNEPDRALYMAVSETAFTNVLNDALGQLVVRELQVRLIVFDETTERITRWID